jgi:autotransporter-associated beta strand protein
MAGLAHAQITVGSNGGDTTDATTYSGSQSLTKTGSNTVVLTGTNSYSGGTIINGGVLQVASDAQLGATSGGITLNGGQIHNNDSFLVLNANRTITLGASGGYLSPGYYKTFTVAGQITGSGDLGVIWDVGTVLLSGSNNYSGTTTIGTQGNNYWATSLANPTLKLGNANALPSGNALTFGTSASNNTATLDLNGYSATVGATTGSSNAVIDNTAAGSATFTMSPASGSANYGGTIKNTVGTISLVKSGAGTQILSGTNTYSGNTSVSAGTLEIASTGLLGSGSYAGAITNNGSFIAGSNSNQTLSGAISGSGALTKNGTGTLTLAGTNTYSGGTTVNAGTLSVSGNGGFSDNLRGTLTINQGGTVTTTGDSTGLGYNTGPSALVINGGTFSAGAEGAHLWTSLGGGVTMTGGTLQSNNGVSTLTGSRIEWNLPVLTVNASANTATVAGRFGLRTSVTMNVAEGAAATDLLVSSAITEVFGSFGITKSGAGTMVLSGSNIYTGATTVSAGTLQFAKAASLYNSATASWTAANLVVNSGATASFKVGGASEFTAANIDTLKSLGSSTDGFKNGSAIGLDTSSGNFSYASNITNTNGGSNALGLTKLGGNMLTLSGTNSYSGGTTVNGGVLQITSDAQLGATNGGITLNGGQIINNVSALLINANRTVTLGANGGYLMAGWSPDLTVAGQITGSGGLGVIWDSGTVVLSGSNNYSGTTTIGTEGVANFYALNANPTLKLGSSNALNSGSALAFGSNANNNTATLDLSGYSARVGAATGASNAVINNTAAGAATLTLSIASGSANYGGTIRNTAGAISLVKSGAGTQFLSGTSTYTGGTTVSAGKLAGTTTGIQGAVVNNAAVEFDQATSGTYAGAMSGTGSLTKSGAGTITLSGANSYAGGTTVSAGKLAGTTTAIQGAVVNNAAVEFSQSANGTYAGAMSGTGSLVKSGTGTVMLSGANSYAGGTTVSAGKLIGTTTAIQGAVVNNAAVEFDQSTSGTYAGAMSGTGSLTKSGAGMVTLSGANTYTGATVVSAGALVINGNISTSSLTTIQSGALLGGSGTVGALTVNVDGTVAPGNSPGILNTGDYNQEGTLSLELNGVLAGVEYDQINVAGTVMLSGMLTATVGYNPTKGDRFFNLNNDGSDAVSGTFFGIADLDTIDLGGYQWQVSYTANYAGANTGAFTGGNDIALMAVPEPTAALLSCLSLLPLLRRRRADSGR